LIVNKSYNCFNKEFALLNRCSSLLKSNAHLPPVHSVDRHSPRLVDVQRSWQIHLRLGIGAAATDAGVGGLHHQHFKLSSSLSSSITPVTAKTIPCLPKAKLFELVVKITRSLYIFTSIFNDATI